VSTQGTIAPNFTSIARETTELQAFSVAVAPAKTTRRRTRWWVAI